jgi:uncharacterized phage protein (predicted DNA packaging)
MLDEVKAYLRIDGTEDDILLGSLIAAAESYIKNATGIDVDESNDLHKLAVSLLVVHWYENRQTVGNLNKIAFSLDSILMQIEYGSGSI